LGKPNTNAPELELLRKRHLIRRKPRKTDVQVVVYFVDLLHVPRGGLLLVYAEPQVRRDRDAVLADHRCWLGGLKIDQSRRDDQMKGFDRGATHQDDGVGDDGRNAVSVGRSVVVWTERVFVRSTSCVCASCRARRTSTKSGATKDSGQIRDATIASDLLPNTGVFIPSRQIRFASTLESTKENRSSLRIEPGVRLS
jgi:hypothetical protein